jgi:hypothetical protein
MNRNSTARKVIMHTSASGKFARKTTSGIILIAALLVPSDGAATAAQKTTAASSQTANPPKEDKPAQKPKEPGAKKPGASSSANEDTCCQSPDAQIETAKNERAKDDAAAKNTARQTEAGINAAIDAAHHAADMEGKAVKMFCWVAGFTSILLLLMLAVVGIGLARGHWSLREALSEKPLVRPKQGEPILLPSASRFIALIGLLAIVTILLGVGYAIIWNLLIYHKPPDSLSEIQSFLLAAASLFAPYIANQLRAAFQTPPGEKPTGEAGATNAPGKTGETNGAQPNAEKRQI